MVGGVLVGSSVIAPMARVACASKIGLKVVPPLLLIHTPPPEVPMNSRPEVVGSTAIAVTFPVALASTPPIGLPPKMGVSLVTGSGPIAVQNGAGAASGIAASNAALRSIARIEAIAEA